MNLPAIVGAEDDSRFKLSRGRRCANAGSKPRTVFRARGFVQAVLLCASLFSAGDAVAGTVALWHFDEPVGLAPGSRLLDAGAGGHALTLGQGGEMVAGKFGHALRPIAAATNARESSPASKADEADFVATLPGRGDRLASASAVNPTSSKLNLGAHDWTIECWIRLEEDAREEGTVFEVGVGPLGEDELVTRFTVLPRENAFAFASITTDDPHSVTSRRVELPNPGGPPSTVVWLQSTTLALTTARIPRDVWFHLALVHASSEGELSVFVDGRRCAASRVRMAALPHGSHAYLSIGRDGRAKRPLPGAIDELRISDHAVYQIDFTPRKDSLGMSRSSAPVNTSIRAKPREVTTSPSQVSERDRRHADDATGEEGCAIR